MWQVRETKRRLLVKHHELEQREVSLYPVPCTLYDATTRWSSER